MIEPISVGSRAHKDLLCRFFTSSFQKIDPEAIRWPELAAADLARLRSLPVWEEAVKTEASTAAMVQAYGRSLRDADLREAVAMNGHEEGRHARTLALLTQRYGITVPRFETEVPKDAEWAFLRVGYGECFDSFFGFGLFALARDSGFFSPALVSIFEPIMQEEARHIIFHANWTAYTRAGMPPASSLGFAFRQGLALALQSTARIKTALRLGGGEAQENFTLTAHSAFGDFTARRFIETCLRENERRLRRYDARLLRPAFMPRLARAALAALPG